LYPFGLIVTTIPTSMEAIQRANALVSALRGSDGASASRELGV